MSRTPIDCDQYVKQMGLLNLKISSLMMCQWAPQASFTIRISNCHVNGKDRPMRRQSAVPHQQMPMRGKTAVLTELRGFLMGALFFLLFFFSFLQFELFLPKLTQIINSFCSLSLSQKEEKETTTQTIPLNRLQLQWIHRNSSMVASSEPETPN